MKRLILPFLIILSLPIYAGHNLIIEMRDTKRHIYILNEKPVIKFNKGVLIVNSNHINISYPIDKIQNYHFEEQATSIPEIEQDTDCIQINYTNKDCLVINGTKGTPSVYVYDTKGKSYQVKSVTEDNTTKIMLDGMGKGIFIINVNGTHSFKIYRQ